MLLYVILFCLVVPFALFMISLYISRHTTFQPSYYHPFECGFESFSSARVPFSLKFYLIVVIFLVFDLEIVILIPIPESVLTFHSWTVIYLVLSVLLLLVVGLLLEWCDGATTWSE